MEKDMERAKFGGSELADILMKVNGEIEPTGIESTDHEREEALDNLMDAMDVLLDEIKFVATERHSKNDTLKFKALDWLSGTSDWVDEILG
jgi:hypothetical protein